MKPFFYSEVIYLYSRNDIDIGRNYTQKGKTLIKTRKYKHHVIMNSALFLTQENPLY